MKKILLYLTIITSSFVYSDSLYLGLFTDHFVSGQFNESNSVAMAQLDSGLTFGAMTNSYNQQSLIFGYVQPDKPIAFGVLFATGYTPENLYLDKYLSSTPIIPLPLVSFDIPINEYISLTSNIIGGVVFNSGITVSL